MTNDNNFFVKFFRKLLPASFGFILAVSNLSACGKRRPPVPPAQSPVLNSVTAVQQGNNIVLRVNRPASDNPIKQVNIYRLNEVVGSPLFLAEDDFAARSTIVAVLDDPYQANNKEVLYTDALSSLTQLARLRYAVRYVYQDNRQSAFSSFALVEPTLQVPAAPFELQAEVTQEAVLLNWQPPVKNIDSSANPNIIGYNVYRTATEANTVKVNQAPVKETNFADATFKFGEKYAYYVRAVTLGTSGAPLESSDSNSAALTPLDTFAPAAPLNLTVAAAPGRLSLFFAANAETDLAGYHVYRSNNEKTALAQWEKLTPSLLKATTFQDERVEAGVTYFYYITAVDNASNVSAPSVVVSETAP